jgi:hypothetical protein
MKNHLTEANRKPDNRKKIVLDLTHITQRSRSNRENRIRLEFLRDIEEEVGRRECGEGRYRMKLETQEDHGRGQRYSWRWQSLEALHGCPMLHKEYNDLMMMR